MRNPPPRVRQPQRRRFLGVELLECRDVPATFTVSTLADTGVDSLRQAIADANGAAGDDSIVFAGAAVGGTISLLTMGGTSFGPNALEVTSTIIITGGGETIARGGAAPNFRLFYVSTGGNLTLSNVTLSNGLARGGNGGTNLARNGGGGGGGLGAGGAIYNQGTVSILNSTLSGNTAQGGTGGAGADTVGTFAGGGGGGGGMGGNGGTTPDTAPQTDGGAGGGGFFGNGVAGTDNVGGGGGGTTNDAIGAVGGVANGGAGGPDSTIGTVGGLGGGGGGGGEEGDGAAGGIGGGGGGGGENDLGAVEAGGAGGFGGGGGGGGEDGTGGAGGFGGGGGGGSNDVVTARTGGVAGFGGGAGGSSAATQGSGGGGGGAGQGGAIFNNGGFVTISNSTFSGNTSVGGIGGVAGGTAVVGTNGTATGGGFFNRNGIAIVTSSTFTLNTAAFGRAILSIGDGASASLTLNNSILGQSVNAQSDLESLSFGGGTDDATGMGSLIRISNGFTGTIVSTADPLLGPLANNGGPTFTFLPGVGSPAIDAGNNAASATLAVDQRGFSPRRFGGTIDIGAVEAGASATVVPLFTLLATGQNTNTNKLVQFTSTAPGIIQATIPVTGLTAGDTLRAIDFRPANGLLYGVAAPATNDALTLYTINPTTGAATAVGAPITGLIVGAFIGMDFNPTVDRIRIVNDSDDNLRINPNTGLRADVVNDTNLNPGGTTIIESVAYTNSLPGATTTTLFAINQSTDNLSRIGGIDGAPSPNGGVVTDIGSLGFTPTGASGFDIVGTANTALSVMQVGGVTYLFSVDLTTGLASAVGTVGDGTIGYGGFTVMPNTPSVSLSIDNPTIAEAGGVATVTATLSNPFTQDVTVNLTFGGTASATDFATSATAITILAGQTTGTIAITGTDDNVDESNETVTVTLGTITNGIAGVPNTVSTSITDDDTSTVSINSVTVAEGNAGTTAFTFTVSLSNPSAVQSSVNFATADGTATILDNDYTLANGTLIFAPGVITQTVTVLVTGDANFEANETFAVNLSAAVNAALGTATGTGTITNDEAVPSVSLSIAPATIVEAGGVATVTATLSSVSSLAVTVNLTLGGTASAGDFATLASSITIPAGQLTGTLTLFAINDTTFDPNETITVTLGTITNGTAGIPNAVTTTILDDDLPASREVLVNVPQFGVGADAGGGSATLFNADKSVRYTVAPFAGFAGGVRTATADFNRDGVADLIVGTGPGRSTRVTILDGVTQAQLFSVDPFEASFTGGVYVSAGDVTGDGIPDLAITPDEGGGPRVDVFSGAVGFPKVAGFFGIDDVNFRGGARSAIADMTGDGVADLIVVAGFGGGPRVAGFDGKSLSGTPQKIFGDFFAFEQTLRNGIFVTAGDLNGDGFADLIAGGGPGGGPRVLAFDGKSLLTNTQVNLANFFGGNVDSRGGIRVAVKDLDGDAQADLVVGSGAAAGSRVTGYLGKNITASGTPPAQFDFDTIAGFNGGVFVG